MKEVNAVKVIARARPLLPGEEIDGQLSCIETIPEDQQIIVANEKCFSFDHTFSETATQEDIYQTCISTIVDKVLEGYNATVLAYGQTGTGKTYTMGTDYSSTSNNNNALSEIGIIPRVLNDIFLAIKDNADCSIKISFLEIYNKSIYDLLTKEKKQIQIQEQASGVKVPGLKIINVTSTSEALHWLQEGCITRTTAATSMNLNSSRSHAIFTIYVHHINEQEEQVSKLHLVDLAGSETVHNDEATRFKEGVNINLGLLALERVISALCKENQGVHVPYRSSALTHLLKDCLNERSFTVMIVCVSPAHSSMLETISTLRYAARARCIKCKPVKNKFMHLENSVVKRKYQSVPRTPFTPYPCNREFDLTVTTPSSFLPAKRPHLNSTIATPYELKDERHLNQIPPPPLFSLSPPAKKEKLCITDEQSMNDTLLTTCLLSPPTVTERTTLNATFQPDLSIMISPLIQKVCSQIDEAVGKKLESLEKRFLEQMEENKNIVFKQSNHTLLLTPLQSNMLYQLKRKINESASKYFSPLHDESSFTPLRKYQTSLALTPQVKKAPERSEIAENIDPCMTPGIVRRKSLTPIPSVQNSPLIRNANFDENHSTTNFKKPLSNKTQVLREKNRNFPDEKQKIQRRRTTVGFRRSPTVTTRRRKEATPYDGFKGIMLSNKKLQKKHNKEILSILNSGSAKDLQALPLVGPKTAQILLTWRQLKGQFANVSDIKNIQGLPKTFFQRFIRANLLTED